MRIDLKQTIYAWLLWLWCLPLTGWAQQFPLTATVQVLPPYAPSLGAFADPSAGMRPNAMRLTLLLNDLNEPSYQVSLRLRLDGPNVTLQTPVGAYPAIYTLTPGVPLMLENADLAPYFDPGLLQVSGTSRSALIQSGGGLPEGNYTLTLEALDIRRQVVVSNTAFFPMYLEDLDPPLIVLPEPVAALPEGGFLPLAWMPQHLGAFPVRYTLAVYDTLPGVPDNLVVQQTTPLFATTLDNQTQYLYGPADPPLRRGHTYLMQVRIQDITGQVIFKNNGYSHVHRFVFADDGTPIEPCLPPVPRPGMRLDGAVMLQWQPGSAPAGSPFTLTWRHQAEDDWQVVTTTDTFYRLPLVEGPSAIEWLVAAGCPNGGNASSAAVIYEPEPAPCSPPQLLSTALNGTEATIAWQTELPEQTVQLRWQAPGRTVDSLVLTADRHTLNGLDTNQVYIGTLQQLCPDSSWSQAVAFRMGEQQVLPRIDFACGVPVQPMPIEHQTPLPQLQPGDTVLAGDFKVYIETVQGSQGRFSGTGTMIWNFPLQDMLGDANQPIAVRIAFADIGINTDYVMYDGNMEISGAGLNLVPPAMTDFITHFGDLPFVNQQLERPPPLLPLDFTLETANIVDGQLVLNGFDQDGEPAGEVIPWDGDDVEIVDGSGTFWAVDSEGNIVHAGELAPGGAPAPGRTQGLGSNGQVTAIPQPAIRFAAGPARYAFDALPQDAGEQLRELYPSIPAGPDGNPYDLSYKAAVHQQSDRFLAELTVDSIPTDSIVFKTMSGRAIPATLTAAGWELAIKGIFTDARETILAVRRLPGDQEVIVGMCELLYLPHRTLNVQAVPLASATIPGDLEATLRDIYAPVGIDFNLTHATAIALPAGIPGADGALDTEGTGSWANYTPELQDLQDHVRRSLGEAYRGDSYYLLFTELPTTSGLAGFMPLDRQWGYVFGEGSEERKDRRSLIAAHELGHGIFGLQHPFSQYNLPRSSTDWLMDYDDGDHLPFRHWDQIHTPDFQVYRFQAEEEGAEIVAHAAFLYSNYIYFTPSQNPTYFAGLTPSGEHYVMDGDAIAAFYPEQEGPWPEGCLAGFTLRNTVYYGWWSKANNQFLGYAPGTPDEYGRLKKSGDYLPSWPPEEVAVYAGRSGEDCVQQIWIEDPIRTTNLFSKTGPITKDLGLGNFIFHEEVTSPNTNCGCYSGPCAEMLRTYANHPYLTTEHILKQVICANPCVLQDLEQYPFFVQSNSPWMEELNNLCAAMLAFGFTPAVLAGAAIGAEGLLIRLVQGIASQSAGQLAARFMVGSTVDMLLQTAFNYYFSENEQITWGEAKEKVDYAACIASGFESTILLQSRWEEALVSATISCFVDGSFEEGQIRSSFDIDKCATGALSAIVISGTLGASQTTLKWLMALPPDRILNGFLKLLTKSPPGVHAAGFQPDGTTLWRLVKDFFPDPIPDEHFQALFKITDPDLTTRLLPRLNADPQLRTDFLDNGLFLRIFNLDLPADVRGRLVEDLFDQKSLRDFIAETPNGVDAWKLTEPSLISKEVNHLRPLAKYISRYPSRFPELQDGFRNSVNQISFLRDELKGFYTTKIKWGIHVIDAREFDRGYIGKRLPQSDSRVDAYELLINPNNESFYLPHPSGGMVQFENIDLDRLQDGKLVMSQSSIYHVAEKPDFLNIESILKPAARQLEAATEVGYKVEWLVSDQIAVNQLKAYFSSNGLNIDVKLLPE